MTDTLSDLSDLCIRIRGWGTPDPRLARALAHENDRRRTYRLKTIGERAASAGWPAERSTVSDARRAQRQALERLEGGQHDFRTEYRRRWQRTAAYESRSRRPTVDATWDGAGHHALFAEGAFLRSQGRPLPPVDLGDGVYPDGDPPTIFDE